MYRYLLYFLAFSFLGWCAEVIFYIFKTGRFVNRGFAKGPFCPIYGVGISLSYLLLSSVESFLLLAILSMAVATAVELAVGVIFDKLLDIRLWDYGEERWNIGGYVCPKFSLVWGVVCALVIKAMPTLEPLVTLAASPGTAVLVYALFVLVMLDIERQTKRVTLGAKYRYHQ